MISLVTELLCSKFPYCVDAVIAAYICACEASQPSHGSISNLLWFGDIGFHLSLFCKFSWFHLSNCINGNPLDEGLPVGQSNSQIAALGKLDFNSSDWPGESLHAPVHSTTSAGEG
jgi:hypothetical protein